MSPLVAAGVNHGLLVVVVASGIAYGTPLLYAALGELLSERSGVLNLGVEGMMLVGAVMGFFTVQRLGGPSALVLTAGVLVAFLIGGLENAGNTLQGPSFPAGLVGVIQGIILFSALGGELLVRYRVRLERTATAAPAQEASGV